MSDVISVLAAIALMAGEWMVYQKMGRKGWEGIIPFYNWYVLCEVLYNNGNRFWFLLIPGYNIYLIIRYMIDLARSFHKSAGFGVGLAFLAPVFMCILGFGDGVYLDGSAAVSGNDPVSNVLNRVEDTVQGRDRPDRAEEIEEYKQLLDSGAITQEEYEAKKKQLLGL